MELDDLRRQWQQAPPAPQVPPAELRHLLKQQSTSTIAKMRRNTWNEITVAVLTVLASFGLLLSHKGPVSTLYTALLVLIVAVMVGYYILQISLLQQLARTDSNVRGHLREVCASLRRLLRFNDKLTLWTGPATWVVLIGYYVWRELSQVAEPRWVKLGWVVGSSLVLGAGLQFGLLKLNRWWSQYRYGRYLDRLEGQLRELDEPAGAIAS
ncbi:MAG: hypothetical protein EOO62_29805 [Hymenobacter sp.]|nr:MAG: hypothetical protein EOO62_29805 [Hymenobacter sp.]